MFIWEWSWWGSWIVILVKKRILVHDWKFYRTLLVTVKKTRMDMQRSSHFAKETKAIPLTVKLTNVTAPNQLDRLLWHAVFFQWPTNERWKRFRARHSIQFSKEPSELKLCSYFWLPNKLLTWRICIMNSLSMESFCKVLLSLWANKIFFFLWRLSNDH